MPFQIATPAFSAGETIPKKFTCDGPDVSPQLNWKEAPVGTQSFALIMDDPDAPVGTWVHSSSAGQTTPLFFQAVCARHKAQPEGRSY